MDSITNFHSKEGVEKLKHFVDDITIWLFCINLKSCNGPISRPHAAQKVDEDGNLWFFGEVHSDKNRIIKLDKWVQFFAHPGKNSYIVINEEI